jgi:hypothetical protein
MSQRTSVAVGDIRAGSMYSYSLFDPLIKSLWVRRSLVSTDVHILEEFGGL